MGDYDVTMDVFAAEFRPDNRQNNAENEGDDELGGVTEGAGEGGDADNHGSAAGKFGDNVQGLVDCDAEKEFGTAAAPNVFETFAPWAVNDKQDNIAATAADEIPEEHGKEADVVAIVSRK